MGGKQRNKCYFIKNKFWFVLVFNNTFKWEMLSSSHDVVTLDVDRDVSGNEVDWVRVTFMLLYLDGILRLWLVHL